MHRQGRPLPQPWNHCALAPIEMGTLTSEQMAKKARRCYKALSPSDWVHQVFLTCDNMLAVQFNRHMKEHSVKPKGPGAFLGHGGVPGPCCLYPATQGQLAEELFDLGLVWSFAGE